MIIENTHAFGQNRQRPKEYEIKQFEKKFELLNTAMNRVERLKKRGYMPKTIEGAKEAVALAEKEFDKKSIIIVKPLIVLVELVG